MTGSETDPTTGLPVFPWHRTCPMALPERYADLRARQPIARVRLATGGQAWLISRHEHVRALLTDMRASSDRSHAGFPYYFPVPPKFRTESSFLGWDPPRHSLHRRLVTMSGEFTTPRVRTLKPRIQRAVDERIDAMLAAGPPADLVSALALPVPLTVICGILGIPGQDHEQLHARTEVLFGASSTATERETALDAMNDYLADVIDRKLAEPGDDLLSRIVERYRDAGVDDRRELVNLIRLLLNGGHEAAASMIALATLTLLEHPEQLALFRSDPAVVPGAVEELLRFLSPGDIAVSRVALADIAIGGVVIREGEGMILLGGSANRDPAAFPDPDVLDLRRDTSGHVAFGHGVHRCLGAEIARAELTIVLETLFHRIPGIRLAKPWNELAYKDGALVYGLHKMPVNW